MLADGPKVEMTMEEAYKALGGNMKEFEYSEYMEYNGVSLSEFCGYIVDITVTSPDYQTPRGLRVGDPIEKVERLYGKPDQGFRETGMLCINTQLLNMAMSTTAAGWISAIRTASYNGSACTRLFSTENSHWTSRSIASPCHASSMLFDCNNKYSVMLLYINLTLT